MANNPSNNNANNDEKWYFPKEKLESSPSRNAGIDAYKELQYRQQAANFIQDMGQRLKVTQLCINTAIVYMHRFYVFHSFTHFHWQSIASAALFLAAKVEEQPRKLEHVIKVALICKNHNSHTNLDINSERYQALSQDLVFNENILLQTLGFDVAIDHPHTHVVKCCHLVRASKDLAQTSYFLASNSLHLTTMCLQYRPTVVACFCIHLACRWANWEIPLSSEQKEWFSYIDPTVTAELLNQLCVDFLEIYDKCPSRLKEKIMSSQDSDKKNCMDLKDGYSSRSYHIDSKSGQPDDPHKHRPRPHEQGSSTSHQQKERDYREKKERERLSQHSTKPSFPSNQYNKQPGLHHHVRPPVDPKLKQHSSRLAAASSHPPFVGRPPEPRDILREAAKDLNSRDLKYNRDTNDSSKDVSKDVIMRESVRELQNVRVDIVKRESNVSNFSDPRAIINDKIMDNLRQKQIDPAKYFQKHESLRKSEDSKLNVNIKLENDIKKHIISGSLEKNSLLSKPYLSTSHRVKSPFESENLKFAPKPGSNQANLSLKNLDTHNESTVPAIDTDVKIKIEPKEEIIPVKKPSLFSPERPEKSPKKRSISPIIHSPHNNSNKKLPEDTSLSSILNIPELVSPIESTSISDINKKPRKPSCSEPELRPVMKKIDQVEGFEHLLRDASIGIKMRQVPDIITPIADTKLDKPIQKEFKLPDPTISNSTNLQPLVNGIETNPTLISNLLKEAPTVPTLSSMSVPNTSAIASEKSTEIVDKEREHHHKSKKKNKEKHKHKDKNKDDRDKKKKHKDKDKEKHKNKSDKYEVDSNSSIAQPIKITIPKDKIQPPDNPKPGTGLKIKIPKDRLKSDGINESSPSIPAGSLKIKIPKDVIKSNLGSESRKRDREKASPSVLPPSKALKSSHGSRSNESKQNGRSSYNKVMQLGDGDVSIHRLAESKYNSKGAPI